MDNEEICEVTGEEHCGWQMSNHDVICLDCEKVL